MATSEPDDNEDGGDSTTVSLDVLLAKQKAFESLMNEFTSDPYLTRLAEWKNQTLVGDYGRLVPGNTKALASAEQVQRLFAKVAGELDTALSKLNAIANSGYINLGSVKQILGDAVGDSLDTAEMWELLGYIQRDGQNTGNSGTSSSP
ncbi:hypothetical protein [Streptomyces termitum]|uniref:hypothetical protein n=1 Tax=Streptomyces termitum TaxID=67368 RepID=UPI0037ADDA3D